MKWHRQVLHIAAKDFRFARWPLIAYVLFVVLVTIRLTDVTRLAGSILDVATILLLPFVMFIAAILVNGDSPSRPDAFFATRPLSPSALIAAKGLVLVMAIVIPGLIGQYIVLEAFSYPRGEVPGILASSVANGMGLLLIGMAVAVLTPGLQAFSITVVFVFIGMQFLVAYRNGVGTSFYAPSAIVALLGVLPFLLSALIIAYQYRTRDTRRARGIGVATLVVLVLAPFVSATSPRAIENRESGSAFRIARASLDGRVYPRRITMTFALDGYQPGDRVLLTSPQIFMQTARGRHERLNARQFPPALNSPSPLLGSGFTWHSGRHFGGDGLTVSIEVTSAQADAISAGDWSVHLAGTLEVVKSRVATTIPLRAGAIVRLPGAIIRLDSVALRDEPTITVRHAQIFPAPSRNYGDARRQVEFLLTNPERREAVYLMSRQGYGGGFVLPMPSMSGEMMEQTYGRMSPEPRDSISAEWIRGAELSIVKWDVVRRVPVSVVSRRIIVWR